MSEIVTELKTDRAETASLVLNLGLAAAIIPGALALGALLLMQIGVIDWWTAYGEVLIGDGVTLPLAMQAVIAAVLAAAAGLGAALWAGPKDFYARAMLNVAITGVTLIGLLAVAV